MVSFQEALEPLGDSRVREGRESREGNRTKNYEHDQCKSAKKRLGIPCASNGPGYVCKPWLVCLIMGVFLIMGGTFILFIVNLLVKGLGQVSS
jgi:hypothetical protein